MEEQLISLKTAKIAKEKGFDVIVNNFYDLYDNPNNNKLSKSCLDNWNAYLSVSAPTQSLLQKWLREEHYIHINITTQRYDGISRVICYYCEIETPHKSFELLVDEETLIDFDTYEQALEIGLQEALNQIPN